MTLYTLALVPAKGNTVTIVAACPECGYDAIWTGHYDTTREPKSGSDRGGTVYDAIDCARCLPDQRPWSLARQIARRLERAQEPAA